MYNVQCTSIFSLEFYFISKSDLPLPTCRCKLSTYHKDKMKLFYKNIFEKLLQELTTSFCETTILTGRRKCPRAIMFTSQHLIVYFLIFFYCLCLNSCTIWMKNLGMCVPVSALALVSTRRSRKTHIA
jgi:hypothetical protein